jgi:hypothetical protein
VKNILIYIVLLLSSNCLIGQVTFDQAQIKPNFQAVQRSTIEKADFDNDGDIDLIVLGDTDFQDAFTALYLNEGIDGFKEVTSPFKQMYIGSIGIIDFDDDNDLDIIINGREFPFESFENKYYSNNGDGIFTEVTGPTLIDGSIKIFDYDNDNDSDLLISGNHLYRNNGSGSFQLITGEPFSGGNPIIGYFNNDNYLDVLINGQNLYKNDTDGTFSLVSNAIPALPSTYNFGDTADIDGDDDTDLLIGFGASNQPRLYLNNGNGLFTLKSGTNIEAVEFGEAKFSDIDNDGDFDFLLTGENSQGLNFVADFYTNDGSGNFSKDFTNSLFEVSNASVVFFDYDDDQDEDVLVSGVNGIVSIDLSATETILYDSDGNGIFTRSQGTTFKKISFGKSNIVDLNGDDLLDVVISGRDSDFDYSIQIYSSDGSGTFSQIESTGLENIEVRDFGIADIENDQDNDLLLVGSQPSIFSRLFTNNGNSSFSEVLNSDVSDFYNGTLKFIKLNPDPYFDLIVSGQTGSTYITELYLNDGNGGFEIIENDPFINVINSSITSADYDNDGDNDIIIMGNSNDGLSNFTRYYKNNGVGQFSEVLNSNFIGLDEGTINSLDLDGDSDIDLLFTGESTSFSPITKIFIISGKI